MYRKNTEGWQKHTDFILLDTFVLQAALLSAYLIVHGWGPFFRDSIYCGSAMTALLGDLFLSVFFDNHKNIRRRGFLEECASAAALCLGDIFLIWIYLLVIQENTLFYRPLLLPFCGIGLVLLVAVRSLWKKYLLKAGSWQGNVKKVLIITRKNEAEKILYVIRDNAFSEIEIEGIILTDTESMVGKQIRGAQIPASVRNMIPYIQTKWIDEILVYLPGEHLPDELLDQLYLMGVTIHRVISIRKDDRGNLETVEKIAGCTCLTQSMRFVSLGDLILKRIMDIAGGIAGLFITAVLTLFVGPAIYFTDPGPIFFTQKRVGKNGRVFKIYKFRSMYQDAEQRKAELMEKNNIKEGFMFKVDNDPRILGSGPDGTKKGIGWFIRKTSIDEFPQFLSVLKGDMSICGTRPPTLDEWEKYNPHHRARLAIKPGLTGLWQVSGRSKIHDFEEVVKLDISYINNWSLWEDFRIILKTVKVIITGDGAE